MKKIAIVGGGGFCREIKCLIDDINSFNPSYELLGFFDDSDNVSETNGLKHLGNILEINKIDYNLCIVIAIGDSITKRNVIKKIINKNIIYPNLIHPSVIKSNDQVFFGMGNIICAGNLITCNISIGNFITINLGCTIGHDTTLEDFCSLMPNVNVSGEVILKKSSYIGTGATIINGIIIGENALVGAGSVVVKDVVASSVVVGNPAKMIRMIEDDNEQ